MLSSLDHQRTEGPDKCVPAFSAYWKLSKQSIFRNAGT